MNMSQYDEKKRLIGECTRKGAKQRMAISELKTEEDLELLVKEYSESLMRYCMGILGSAADAQDTVQTAFIRAWEKRATLKRQNSLRSWLFRIAYRACLDELRRRRNTEELLKGPGLSYGPQFEEGMSAELAAALAKLSALDRAILEERILEDMSYAELSVVHRLPQTALRARYSRARRKLFELLTHRGKEGDET